VVSQEFAEKFERGTNSTVREGSSLSRAQSESSLTVGLMPRSGDITITSRCVIS